MVKPKTQFYNIQEINVEWTYDTKGKLIPRNYLVNSVAKTIVLHKMNMRVSENVHSDFDS